MLITQKERQLKLFPKIKLLFVYFLCLTVASCASMSSATSSQAQNNAALNTNQSPAVAGGNYSAIQPKMQTDSVSDTLTAHVDEKTKSPFQKNARRKVINFPEDCQYAAVGSTKNRQAVSACAAALEEVAPQLRRIALDEKCDTKFEDVLSTDYACKINFYPFSVNKYLVELRCLTGAYNEINAYLMYDESKLPATIQILKFPSLNFDYDEDAERAKKVEQVTVETVGGRYFNPRTKQLIVFIKAHGIGDAGRYARYSFPNDQPKLEEYRARFKWSGREYQLADVIKSPPQTWKRYYP